jgi:hypothetical protein
MNSGSHTLLGLEMRLDQGTYLECSLSTTVTAFVADAYLYIRDLCTTGLPPYGI